MKKEIIKGLTITIEGTWYEVSNGFKVIASGNCTQDTTCKAIFDYEMERCDKFNRPSANSQLYDVFPQFDDVYMITEITDTDDPYLQYSKHFKAVGLTNGLPYGGAITECINPNFDLKGVLEGTKKSLYA